MAGRFSAGDLVQTPFGKGVVREVRNNDRLLVDVQGRALVFTDGDISPLDSGRSGRRGPEREARPTAAPVEPASHPVTAEIDLHGLTVEDALARVESALNDALLTDMAGLRIIHGRSGGRIKAALHQRLEQMPFVRRFRLDPHNEGVTIVKL